MYIPTPFRWSRMSSFPHIGSKRFAGYNPRSPKLLGQRLIIYGSQKKLNWLTRIPVVKEYLRPTLLQMLCRRFRKQKWYTSYLFISTPKKKTFQLDTQKKMRRIYPPSHNHGSGKTLTSISQATPSAVASRKARDGEVQLQIRSQHLSGIRLGKGGFGLQEIPCHVHSPKKTGPQLITHPLDFMVLVDVFLMKIWKECHFVHIFLLG